MPTDQRETKERQTVQKKPESDGKNKKRNGGGGPRQRAEPLDNEHLLGHLYNTTVNGASGVKVILLMCSPFITIHNCQIKLTICSFFQLIIITANKLRTDRVSD